MLLVDHAQIADVLDGDGGVRQQGVKLAAAVQLVHRIHDVQFGGSLEPCSTTVIHRIRRGG